MMSAVSRRGVVIAAGIAVLLVLACAGYILSSFSNVLAAVTPTSGVERCSVQDPDDCNGVPLTSVPGYTAIMLPPNSRVLSSTSAVHGTQWSLYATIQVPTVTGRPKSSNPEVRIRLVATSGATSVYSVSMRDRLPQS
jgi:hypothetical protein